MAGRWGSRCCNALFISMQVSHLIPTFLTRAPQQVIMERTKVTMSHIMDLVDSKYIGLVSSRLQKFKRVKDNLYNFRCPICGDSQKNKNKTRGYIYQVKNNTNFKCHNCGASMSFNNFVKRLIQLFINNILLRNLKKDILVETLLWRHQS